MSVELVSIGPTVDTEQRVLRIQMDCLKLCEMSEAEIKGAYEQIEKARDALSRVLDRADGKDA